MRVAVGRVTVEAVRGAGRVTTGAVTAGSDTGAVLAGATGATVTVGNTMVGGGAGTAIAAGGSPIGALSCAHSGV